MRYVLDMSARTCVLSAIDQSCLRSSYDFNLVIGRAVSISPYPIYADLGVRPVRVRPEHAQETFSLVHMGIEPHLLTFPRKDHRHHLMQSTYSRARLRGDDSIGQKRVAVCSLPHVVQP